MHHVARRLNRSRIAMLSAVFAALAVTIVAGQVTPAPSTNGTAAISGVVSDIVTGRPIAGASVVVISVGALPDGQPFRSMPRLTDRRGRFVVPNLPSGVGLRFLASKLGYNLSGYLAEGGSPLSTEAAVVRLSDDEWLREVNVRMSRFGAIEGRVVDERAEPVVGAAVRVFERQSIAGREQLVPGPVAATDDRGAYRVPYLRAGNYYVAVLSVQATVPASTSDVARRLPLGGLEGRGGAPPSSTGVSGASIDVNGRHRLLLTSFVTPPPPGDDVSRAYAPVFYPTARHVNDAQLIDLASGSSRTSVDFQLAPVATSRVTGRVSGSSAGATNMVLRLMAPGTEHMGFGSEIATSIVEADGTFTFLNVPHGAYVLIASRSVPEVSSGSGEGRLPMSAGYGNARGFSMVYPAAPNASFMWWQSDAGGNAGVWGRQAVDVSRDLADVTIALQPTISVRGRLVFDDPVKPQPNERFGVSFEPVDGDVMLGSPNAFTAANDTTYSFTVNGFMGGRYLARLGWFLPWRVKSVTARGVDVTTTGVDGSSGMDLDDVVIALVRPTAELSGVVRDGRGQPRPGPVILFPVDPRLRVSYGLTPDRLLTVPAATDGRYSFTRLLDGDYFVVALDRLPVGGWLDPAFLAAAASQATTVAIRDGASISQALVLKEVVVR